MRIGRLHLEAQLLSVSFQTPIATKLPFGYTGFTGRDLTASLISQALTSGVKGPAQAALLKAWDALGGADQSAQALPAGQNTAVVSESIYKYVLSLNA